MRPQVSSHHKFTVKFSLHCNNSRSRLNLIKPLSGHKSSYVTYLHYLCPKKYARDENDERRGKKIDQQWTCKSSCVLRRSLRCWNAWENSFWLFLGIFTCIGGGLMAPSPIFELQRSNWRFNTEMKNRNMQGIAVKHHEGCCGFPGIGLLLATGIYFFLIFLSSLASLGGILRQLKAISRH